MKTCITLGSYSAMIISAYTNNSALEIVALKGRKAEKVLTKRK